MPWIPTEKRRPSNLLNGWTLVIGVDLRASGYLGALFYGSQPKGQAKSQPALSMAEDVHDRLGLKKTFCVRRVVKQRRQSRTRAYIDPSIARVFTHHLLDTSLSFPFCFNIPRRDDRAENIFGGHKYERAGLVAIRNVGFSWRSYKRRANTQSYQVS